MKSSKGFTLIELLAVIVILAIIALIAAPVILNIINDARKSAAKDSALGVVSAAKLHFAQALMNTTDAPTITSDRVFTCDGTTCETEDTTPIVLSVNGTVPVGDVKIGTDGTITSTSLKFGSKYEFIITNGKVEEKSTTSYIVYANGTAVYFNPVTGAKCTAGEAVSTTGTKTGCMKWYAFNDGGASTDTINLILDHNTTAVVAWNSTGGNVSGPTNVMTQLVSDTSSWAGVPTRTDSYSVSNGTATYTINYSTYKARLIKASEIATITGNSSFVEATTPYTSWFYLDSNNQTQTATTTGASNYDWLFDYTNGCTRYGCNIADASNHGYWTSTAVSGDAGDAWYVFRNGRLISNLVGSLSFSSVDDAVSYGVRPVITILKSNL